MRLPGGSSPPGLGGVCPPATSTPVSTIGGPAMRQVAQSLVIPQGFTLSVSGSMGTLVGERGYPGALAVWLFVLGGGLGFCAVTAGSGLHHDPGARPEPVTGPAVFNLVPVAVVPTVLLIAGLIGSDRVAFAIAGFLAVVLYMSGLTGLIALQDHLAYRAGRMQPALEAPPTQQGLG
jgi:hypothetical protein